MVNVGLQTPIFSSEDIIFFISIVLLIIFGIIIFFFVSTKYSILYNTNKILSYSSIVQN